jgi:hypothetical protein
MPDIRSKVTERPLATAESSVNPDAGAGGARLLLSVAKPVGVVAVEEAFLLRADRGSDGGTNAVTDP